VYYDSDAPNSGPKVTRDITINDYIKAMYTPRGDYQATTWDSDEKATAWEDKLRPRAALPLLSGNNLFVDGVTGKGYANDGGGTRQPLDNGYAGVTRSIQYDYAAAVTLYYYHPKIRGTMGKGFIKNEDLIPVLGDSNNAGYETPNAALIPISNLIWTYAQPNIKRKENTDNEGVPRIKTAAGGAANTQAGRITNGQGLYNQAPTFWDLVLEYENPNDPTAVTRQVPYVPTKSIPGDNDYTVPGVSGRPASNVFSGTNAAPNNYRGKGAWSINETWPANPGNPTALDSDGNPDKATTQAFRYFYEGASTVTDTQAAALNGGYTIGAKFATEEGDIVYDNSAAEDEDEARTFTIRVLEPPSAGVPFGPGITQIRRAGDEIEIPYIMQR